MSHAVFYFPGTGSFGGEFSTPTTPVKYPGRFGPHFGTPADSFTEVVDSCADQIRASQALHPLLVGHSYGAYVAYATAQRLRETGTEISTLAVAAAAAPTRLSVPEGVADSPEHTAEYLNAIDPDLLGSVPSPDWREIVTKAAMHDLRLLAEFTPPTTSLDSPVHAAVGSADPVSEQSITDWKLTTDGPFAAHTFPGRHDEYLDAWLADLVS
ncbi:thioesterase II family protein [Actinokineospora enzanensis]|uniref:thioesterase II family protein n=1 Tax=Actinokineospora enzanensis TaxID=155975 RepID=UPI0003629568|nr:alpha/beta fold hydrolase [Actinokineospora enzanensis]